jgi:hypothetical protein
MMSDSSVPPPLPVRSDFPRKVTLLFLLIIDTAIVIYFLLKKGPEPHQLLRHFFADVSLGLVAGFGARFLFKRRAWFVRVITATACLIIGLLVLGVLTNWRTGLGPLSFWRNTVDWTGLAQIILGMGSMFLAMQAWSKPVRARTEIVPAAPVVTVPTPPKANPKLQTRTKAKRRRTKPALSGKAVLKSDPARIEIPAKPSIKRKRSAKTESKLKPGLSLRKPKVRLSRIEKHLCPYCLEPVVRNDPRGIVECEICHTLHHGDCWAIAGSCQVPHYTA